MIAQNEPDCVLLAGRHQGLSEGIRGLLETVFEVVVMVADEMSLLEGAKRVAAQMAIVDMSIGREDGFGAVRRLRETCPAIDVYKRQETYCTIWNTGQKQTNLPKPR